MKNTCFELLKETLIKSGDFTAVVDKNVILKLSELIEYSEKFGCYLSSLGIQKGDVVSLYLPNSAQVIIAFYALSSIGAIADFIQINESENAVINRSENSSALICFDNCKRLHSNQIVCTDNDFKFDSQFDDHAFAYGLRYKCNKVINVADENDVAVYLHGGGTDGFDKTVMLTGKNINRASENISFVLKNSEYGKEFSLLVLPVSHAFGLVTSLHFPLINGMGVVVCRMFNPDKIFKSLNNFNITYLTGVPQMYEKLIESKLLKQNSFSNIKYAFCGGDYISADLIKRVNDVFSGNGSVGKLWQGYGMSELASVCCLNFENGYRENSVGKPVGNVRIKIINQDENNVGEIAIAGDTVMKNYLDDSAGFITDDGIKYFPTGDMGYLDSEGFLHLSGRKKRIVIISGYNIFPVDIENTAEKTGLIKESCAVEYREDNKAKIVLYAVPNSNNICESQVIKVIASKLSEFSVPSKIIFTQSLPRTAFGKIDYKKLQLMNGEKI